LAAAPFPGEARRCVEVASSWAGSAFFGSGVGSAFFGCAGAGSSAFFGASSGADSVFFGSGVGSAFFGSAGASSSAFFGASSGTGSAFFGSGVGSAFFGCAGAVSSTTFGASTVAATTGSAAVEPDLAMRGELRMGDCGFAAPVVERLGVEAGVAAGEAAAEALLGAALLLDAALGLTRGDVLAAGSEACIHGAF